MNKFLYLTFFSIILIITLIATCKINSNAPQKAPDLQEGQSDIAFFRVKITIPEFSFNDINANDQRFTKQDLEGKYSIVNFFASWCTTCKAEHEILMALQAEQVIDIYGIAWRDGEESAKQYLDDNGNPYKKVGSDTNGLFTKLANIQAVPETWIVDKKGNAVMRYRGNLQEFSINEIKEFLKKNNALN